ncbi:MAG TPA: ASPIC/UnbV domain-containing protein, partial [Candidatus Polarisedimenticolia bacterium]|nr:ASPIC/UnbV domain-containing protein [Candidatus Polarisedimenticolia bacterium]
AGGHAWIRDLSAGGSYLSTHDPRLSFGLGRARVVERLDVRWPDGTRKTVRGVPVDRVIEIKKEAPGGAL